MLVVTTPAGQIGRHVLARLVAAGEPVRAVARDRGRIGPGLSTEVDVVEGSHAHPATLARALAGAEAVFWCVPPDARMSDPREYYLDFCRPLADALPGSSVRRVVMVSSGGRGRPEESGPIGAAFEVEEMLEATGIHLRALRCGYFMENLLHQVDLLRHQGMFSHPISGDIAIPVCATRDIGARAVELLHDRSWTGQADAGVHGPAHLSFNEMARLMSRVLGRPIRYREVPGPAFEATLVEHGASEAFARGMVDLFRALAGGLHDAHPRTPESTTPTTFEAWCADTLKPAMG
jgi:uncharacterized protein YbjT (DUF2867 family)